MAKVVIVDCSTFMRGSLKFIVEHFGNEVVGVADTGQAALESCAALKPALIIMEVSPREGMDGITTIKELRKIDPRVLIAVTFAPGEEELVEQAKAAGASGQIAKPFLPREISEELVRMLKKN